jgi:MFS family permease
MGLVAFLWFALALNYIDRQMVYSIFPALKSELHFTDVQLGLTGSVFAWVYALCMPVAGYLSDRLRRDRMIVAGMALWSAATLGCGLSNSVFMFLLWRSVMGITESLYYPAAVSALASAHTGATRSKAMGIHQSAQLAGIVAGGSYGGWMADHAGWRVGFGTAAVVGILYSFVLSRNLPLSQASREQMIGHPIQSSIQILQSRCYLALSVAFFAFCAMLWIFYAWLPTFLFERFHLSMAESGFRATLFVQVSCGAGIVVGGILADRLSKRIPAARLYIAAVGILLCAPFGYLTFAAQSLTWATVCSSAYGAFSGLMVANVFAAAYDIVAPGSYGLAAGLLNMAGGLAATIMIYLAGLWKNSLGFEALLGWVALGCGFAALLLAATVVSLFTKENQARLLT